MKNQKIKNLIKNNVRIQKELKKEYKTSLSNYRKLDKSYATPTEISEINDTWINNSISLLKEWQPEPYDINYFGVYIMDILRQKMRYFHIANGLIKGRKYEDIEKPRKENELSIWAWEKINQIVQEYSENVE